MTPIKPIKREVRATVHPCRALKDNGFPCRSKGALARVTYRHLQNSPTRRIDACGLHVDALTKELTARGCFGVTVKPFVTMRLRRTSNQYTATPTASHTVTHDGEDAKEAREAESTESTG